MGKSQFLAVMCGVAGLFLATPGFAAVLPCDLFLERYDQIEKLLETYPARLSAYLAKSPVYGRLDSARKISIYSELVTEAQALREYLESQMPIIAAETPLPEKELLSLSMNLDDLLLRSSDLSYLADPKMIPAQPSGAALSGVLDWQDVVDGRATLLADRRYRVRATLPNSQPPEFFIEFDARLVRDLLRPHQDYAKFLDAIQKGFGRPQDNSIKRVFLYAEDVVEVKIKSNGHWRLYGTFKNGVIGFGRLSDTFRD